MALDAIAAFVKGEAALQSAKGKPCGVLKVTAPVDLGRALLPRIVHAYTAKYPDAKVYGHAH